MRFFRGIAVPGTEAENTIKRIEIAGLSGNEGHWNMAYDHPGAIDDLLAKTDLTINDTRDTQRETRAICACGELSGAAYYALKHNRTPENDTSILIEFEADESSVAVDGRDFLYAAFQLGDPGRARRVLRTAFGEAVLRYAERAWLQESQDKRIALCDLATHDPAVIRAHHANELVLGGRHGTVFRNAFLVRVPIPGGAILRVQRVGTDTRLPSSAVMLRDVLSQ